MGARLIRIVLAAVVGLFAAHLGNDLISYQLRDPVIEKMVQNFHDGKPPIDSSMPAMPKAAWDLKMVAFSQRIEREAVLKRASALGNPVVNVAIGTAAFLADPINLAMFAIFSILAAWPISRIARRPIADQAPTTSKT